MPHALVIAGASAENQTRQDPRAAELALIAERHGAVLGSGCTVDLPTGAQATRWELTGHVSDTFLASDTLGAIQADCASAVSDQGCDVAIVPADLFAAHGGLPALLVADMESTIIAQECLDELAGECGAREAVSLITVRAMAGELAFEEALAQRVGLLAGLPLGKLDALAERLTFNPGALEFVQALRANGTYCALVSGGFTFFTEQVALTAGFHQHRANTLEIADGALTGHVVPPILGVDAKAEAVRALTGELEIGVSGVLTIGDGANDVAMTRVVARGDVDQRAGASTGLGVGYRPKPVLRDVAHVALDHADMSAVLALCPGFCKPT